MNLMDLLFFGALFVAPAVIIWLVWWRWWRSRAQYEATWRKSLLRNGLVAGSANLVLPYSFLVDSWLGKHVRKEPSDILICLVLFLSLYSLVAAALGQGSLSSRILLMVMPFIAIALWVLQVLSSASF